MDFDEYLECAERTSAYKGCHWSETGINPNGDDRLNMALLGIGGEAGEILDLFKKVLHHGHPYDRDRVIKETGDLLWYIAELCNALQLDLKQVARRNIEKLGARYGADGFSSEASLNRKPGDV